MTSGSKRFDYTYSSVGDLAVQTTTNPKNGRRSASAVLVSDEPIRPTERFWTSLYARYGFNKSFFKYFAHDEVFGRIATDLPQQREVDVRQAIAVDRRGHDEPVREGITADLEGVGTGPRHVGRLDDAVAVADVAPLVAGERVHQVVVADDRPGRIADGQQAALAGLLVPLDAQPHPILRLDFGNGMVGMAKTFRSTLALGRGGDDVIYSIIRALDGFGNDEGSRRRFLQSTAAAIGSLVLPRRRFAGNSDHSFHFIHVDTLNSWAVADPAAWCLQNACEPILRRARKGLATLTVNDGDRIVRLVVRRCRLNLLEVHPEKVVLQHWASHRADLRPFFKQHGLAQPQREVVLWDRKDDYVVERAGDDFLFGDPLLPGYPLGLFVAKYERRFSSEADDWQAAPGTWSGFAWDGLECNRIPWASLKSAWRRGSSTTCPNCDAPTLLVNFGHAWVSMFHRTPRLIHICSTCCRSFEDATAPNMTDWLKANLDRSVWPACEVVWDRRVKSSSI